jgi:dTDP-4-amino-4,6-dideoxygalactose transaminase
MIYRCDLSKQYERFREEIDESIKCVLASGRYTLGKNVSNFENRFSEYIGMKYGVGVNSGTDALILALRCAGIKDGDEVITTPFTAIPTYSAIKEVGAVPVFADIEKSTFLMDLNKVGPLITEKTKAIIPVHLFGNVIDIPRLQNIVGIGVTIIEDCAQSHGGAIRKLKAGSMGDFSAFSFYPTKNLGGYGDGGIVLTNNGNMYDRLKKLRMYGMENKDIFVTSGINSRLDELQAAVLNVKLKYLDQLNEERVKKAAYYSDMLSDVLEPQNIAFDVSPVWHIYSCLCKDLNRNKLASYLHKRGIQTNVYYSMPLNEQVGHIKYHGPSEVIPVAKNICESIIALPFYPEIEEQSMCQVVNTIREFIEMEV